MKLWVNEHGFVIESDFGESHYSYDVSPLVESNAACLYDHRWAVFNEAMRSANELVSNHTEPVQLTIHSDSTIIEELRDGLEIQSRFAKSVAGFFLYYDCEKFSPVVYIKCSSISINDKIRSCLK